MSLSDVRRNLLNQTSGLNTHIKTHTRQKP